MKSVRFYSCQSWERPHRRWKVIGFLITRGRETHCHDFDVMSKIFSFVHDRASHHGKVMRQKWKHAEKRIINRCKKRI